jgi:Gpi18-like mannosyltransferase
MEKRVTRWVCEKNAQNVAQPIFVKINTFSILGKKRTLGDFCNFYKTVQNKRWPIGRKFAQSGHSDGEQY